MHINHDEDNKIEKENSVIDLLSKGLYMQQISKQDPVSFTYTAKLKRK